MASLGGAAFLAILAAMPSLLWLLDRPDFLTDDFGHALTFEREGLIGGALERSFESTGRPLVGLYYLFVYGLVGDNPVAHALVLATAQQRAGHRGLARGSTTASARCRLHRRAGARHRSEPGQHALVVRNRQLRPGHDPRDSSDSAALAIRNRPILASVLLAAGVLLFEGTAGLVAALIGLWILEEPGPRWKVGVATGAPAAIAAAGMYLASPKRGGGSPPPLDSLRSMPEGLLGTGTLGQTTSRRTRIRRARRRTIAWSLLRLLPSFGSSAAVHRTVRIGTVIAVCSALPFVVGGSPFATSGIFDRTNLMPVLGVCIILGALIARPRNATARHTDRRRGRPDRNLPHGELSGRAGLPGGSPGRAARSSLASPQTFRPTVNRSSSFRRRLGAPGVAAFIYPGDLAAAIELRSSRPTPPIRPALGRSDVPTVRLGTAERAHLRLATPSPGYGRGGGVRLLSFLRAASFIRSRMRQPAPPSPASSRIHQVNGSTRSIPTTRSCPSTAHLSLLDDEPHRLSHLAWITENLVEGQVLNKIAVDLETTECAKVALERMMEIT